MNGFIKYQCKIYLKYKEGIMGGFDNKNERIQIRVTKEQKEYIRKRARQNGMAISEYMLYVVMKDIQEEEQKRCRNTLLFC